MENEILNAQITATMLGKEDHGIFTCELCIEGDGWGCFYGGYVLDEYDKTLKKRVCGGKSLEAINQILETLEVKKWEDLKGQYIRCETSGSGWGAITKIGHLIKDKWFSFEEFFKKQGVE